jgi:hypothetical protein
MGFATTIDKDVMGLQYHTNSRMEVQDPCGERDPTSGDASQAIRIKVEKVSDADDDDAGPVPITCTKIKAKPEVRCTSLYVHCEK